MLSEAVLVVLQRNVLLNRRGENDFYDFDYREQQYYRPVQATLVSQVIC